MMPGLRRAEEQGAAASPPSRPNLPSLPTPVPSHGQGSASLLQGCLFRRAGGVCLWFGNAAKVQPSQMNMCSRAVPRYAAYAE